MYIKEIRIKNFRSIVKTEILLNDLSIFVGLNDVGKSNILKALNLFFNSETDYGKSFNFHEDYSKNALKRNKKAEEIIIEIILTAPINYKADKDIVWRKIWRNQGLHINESYFIDKTTFPIKSKLPSWLQSIRFSYVPAIRDNSYFEILLGKLHDSLAETIEVELQNAGDGFIDKIKVNTKRMIGEIDSRLKIKSQIKLPSNLQSLFKTLDFSTAEGDFEISLSNRGDGIKTRYIPVILKFISDQLNINKRKGSANTMMIWGYEEPENNLEMLAAFKLANDFMDYSKEIQLLITTHSPGFYSLINKNEEKVNLYKVSKKQGKDAEITRLISYKDLDDDMGIMPIIAPYVLDKINEIESLQSNITEYKKKLSNYNKHVIFVEGDDEVRIFESILITEKVDNIISVSRNGFGCSGVKNQMMAWAWVAGTSQHKSFGVFDNDKSGNLEFAKLSNEIQFKEAQQNLKVKASVYKAPPHLHNIKRKIPSFPIELEEMFTYDLWEIALNKGWLEKRSIEELNSFVMLDNEQQSIKEKIDEFGFTNSELIYVFNKIPDKHKEKFSKEIVKNSNIDFETKYGYLLKMVIDQIIPFLIV
jgi:hypothetical protein